MESPCWNSVPKGDCTICITYKKKKPRIMMATRYLHLLITFQKEIPSHVPVMDCRVNYCFGWWHNLYFKFLDSIKSNCKQTNTRDNGCKKEVQSSSSVGTLIMQISFQSDKLTLTQKLLASSTVGKPVTDCCPLPVPYGTSCECKRNLVRSCCSFITLPCVTYDKPWDVKDASHKPWNLRSK
jgi:hypothetical protein